MAVTTVFFDVGGTLVSMDESATDVWVAVLGSFGVKADPSRIDAAGAEVAEALRPALYDHVGRMREFWLRFDAEVLRRLGVPDPGGRISEAVYERFHRLDAYHAFPDSIPTLHALRSRGFRLGVISNATEEVRLTLEGLGLAGYFDHVTFSQEARSEKPDAGVFRFALRRHACRPEDAVHVGDLYEADVVGARGVGIAPILIDRADVHRDADCPRVRSLLEVGDLLPGDAKS